MAARPSKDLDHFYTTDPKGEIAPDHGYKYEGIAGYVYLTSSADRTPIYRRWSAERADHLHTSNEAETKTADGTTYITESIGWYSPNSRYGGFVEFKRYYQGAPYYDHFYTANEAEPSPVTAPGYRAEGLAGYVLPPAKGLCVGALMAEGLYPLYRWYRHAG